jgi:hypothetical protein
MDRLRLRKRLRLILAVGSILIALAYLGPAAIRARPRWGAYRAAANVEKMKADLEAKLASDAAGQAEQLRREGRMSEAEQLAKDVEGHRQKETLHRRNSQEFLGRWW